jgi:GH43 family beta-xylosidase
MQQYLIKFTKINLRESLISFSIAVYAVNEIEALQKITRNLPATFTASTYPDGFECFGEWSEPQDDESDPLSAWLKNECP